MPLLAPKVWDLLPQPPLLLALLNPQLLLQLVPWLPLLAQHWLKS